MTYLLDTHTFIWSILDSPKLSERARQIIANSKHELCVSAVSFWEIAIKTSLKKFSFAGINVKDFPQFAERLGFSLISIDPGEAITSSDLQPKANHKDPFDRLLIWQAISRRLPLISNDSCFAQYQAEGLKLVW